MSGLRYMNQLIDLFSSITCPAHSIVTYGTKPLCCIDMFLSAEHVVNYFDEAKV